MFRELTTRQLTYCRRAIRQQLPDLAELYESWFAEASVISKTKRSVVLPAVAWSFLAEALAEYQYRPDGRETTEAASAVRNALRIVRRGVMVRENHPALSGGRRGVPGHLGERVPAWRTSDGGWSPYPSADGAYTVLWPAHKVASGFTITVWEPAWPPTAALYLRLERYLKPENHWAFMPAPEPSPPTGQSPPP